MMRAAPRALGVLLLALLPMDAAIGCSDQEGSATNERDASGAAGGPDGGSSKWDATPPDSSTPDAGSGGSAGSSADGAAGAASGGTAGIASGGTGGTIMTCPTIKVTSAIYAANCGAPTNVSSVFSQCDGKEKCSYTMDYTVDPGFDPAFGCGKDMTVAYDCVDGSGKVVTSLSAFAAPEAGVGAILTLECACAP